jgi:HNH endonuclease
MPFAPNIRQQVLVNSHRRCCVCHEFAGREANVHHIIQEADGGENSIENAICLCLPCHSEAGHFNPRHPMGTKYSPDELRQHRDQWWAVCAAQVGAGKKGAEIYATFESRSGTWSAVKEVERVKGFLAELHPALNELHAVLRNGSVSLSHDARNKITHFGSRFGILGWNNDNWHRSFSPELRQRQEEILNVCSMIASALKGWTDFFNEYSRRPECRCPAADYFSTRDAKDDLESTKQLMRQLLALCDELAAIINTI